MWACSFKSLCCLLYPAACPQSLGSGHFCSRMDWRCTSLRCIEPVLSASFFIFDPLASKAALKVLCKKWKKAVTNWKSRGLKNQAHRSSFPVSLLCNTGQAIQTDVRQYAELSSGQERSLVNLETEWLSGYLEIFCRNAPRKKSVHFWAMRGDFAV